MASQSCAVARREILGGTQQLFDLGQQLQQEHQLHSAVAEPVSQEEGAVLVAPDVGFVGDAGFSVAVPHSSFDHHRQPMHADHPPLQYGCKLGQGAYGEVREVVSPIGQLAWPCDAVAKVFNDPSDQTLIQEVAVYARLEGSRVAARFLGQQDNAIFLERLPMTLRTWANRNPSLDEIKCVLRGVLQAVQCMHDRGVYHQDIKDDNIMIEVRKDGNIVVRFIDFGLSEMVDHDSRNSFDVCLSGTPCCMPLEKLERMADGSTRATVTRRDLVNADMWAVGVLAHVLLFREYPYGCDRDHRAVRTKVIAKKFQRTGIRRYTRPSEEESGQIKFVEGFLNSDCAARWTPAQALAELAKFSQPRI